MKTKNIIRLSESAKKGKNVSYQPAVIVNVVDTITPVLYRSPDLPERQHLVHGDGGHREIRLHQAPHPEVSMVWSVNRQSAAAELFMVRQLNLT